MTDESQPSHSGKSVSDEGRPLSVFFQVLYAIFQSLSDTVYTGKRETPWFPIPAALQSCLPFLFGGLGSILSGLVVNQVQKTALLCEVNLFKTYALRYGANIVLL